MKKITTLLVLIFPALLFIHGQNIINIDIGSGNEFVEELTVGEYNDVPLSVKSRYSADKETLAVEVTNNDNGRTFWFATRQITYQDFKKHTKDMWETNKFKEENPTIRTFINDGQISHNYSDVAMFEQGGTFRFELNNIKENPGETLKYLITFYTSIDENKGKFLWKKSNKMEQRISIEYNITFPEKDPCKEYDFSFQENLLQSKIEELARIKEDFLALNKRKRKNIKITYEEQVNQISDDIAKRNEPCTNQNIENKIKIIKAEVQEILETLNETKDSKKNTKTAQDSPVDCSSYVQSLKKLKDQATSLYLKIRNGGNASQFKNELNNIKQQAESAYSANPGCRSLIQKTKKEFDIEYNAALKELNKK